jgi:hypothetical protein
MMGAKRVKAYQVHDGDEGWEVVFATNSATARREGANGIGCDWEDIESCRRMPVLDQYAPGPVPALAMIDAGWNFECHNCGEMVDSDNSEAVCTGRIVYCCEQCSQIDWAKRRANKNAQVALIELFASKFPECTIKRVHVYGQKLEARKPREGMLSSVSFDFPGGKYGATFEYGSELCWVAQGDLDAWNQFTAPAPREVEAA